MKADRVRLKDIARAAGVSVQTVSNLVNGHYDQMGSATRARLEGVMEQHGYHPNPQARGLRLARTETLGFLILDEAMRFLADPMTDVFLAGLGDVLREEQYSLLVRAAQPSRRVEELLRPILEGRVDGAVVFLSGAKKLRHSYIRALQELATPCILFQEHTQETGGTRTIAALDREGSRGLCRRLITLGHENIAFLTAEQEWSAIEERHAGYIDAHGEAGLTPRRELTIRHGAFDAIDGAAGTMRALDCVPRPTAIMCANDLLACGALMAARSRNLKIPDDLAITGFDDFNFAAALDPPLTTVRIPGYEMGRVAAEDLIGSLGGQAGARPMHRRFETSLCIRGSG